jgi:hypothetical protein
MAMLFTHLKSFLLKKRKYKIGLYVKCIPLRVVVVVAVNVGNRIFTQI